MPCKTPELQREFGKRWIAKRRSEAITQLGGKCEHCGSKENLEFDHIDRKSKVCNISTLWTRTKEFRDIELRKCQLLCCECHKIKTAKEFGAHVTNGMITMHKNGCRCLHCKEIARKQSYARKMKWKRKMALLNNQAAPPSTSMNCSTTFARSQNC